MRRLQEAETSPVTHDAALRIHISVLQDFHSADLSPKMHFGLKHPITDLKTFGQF